MRLPGFIAFCVSLVPLLDLHAQMGVVDSGGPRKVTIVAPPAVPAGFAGRYVPPKPQPATQDPLTIELLSNLESRLERNRINRCTPSPFSPTPAACISSLQPLFDFDFMLRAGGRVGERVNVAVDYDSRREFDASNNISITYQGRDGAAVRRVDVGNVSFAPPASRFITSGIPSGNYGIMAEGVAGPLELRAIAAQQKGRVVRAESFTIGDRSLRAVSTVIEDYRFEPRRFFFTIDPEALEGYPNIDILDTRRMATLSAALPDTLRPVRLFVYRVLIGGQPPNPNGPQFIARGARNANRGLIYEYMREGIDYYADPSLLWIALARQLRRDERLVVAYSVALPDGGTVYAPTGGTPDLTFTPEPQFANLLWDPEVQPGDLAFNREIRSVYRLGGEEMLRESVELRVVTGPGEGQERAPAGSGISYLEMFGLSQQLNHAEFDAENRLWPRPADAVLNRGAGATGTPLVRDYFVVFPSLQPFASDGLVSTGAPANDTIYAVPAEDIFTSRRPQSVYRLVARYATGSDAASGMLSLGAFDIRRASEQIVIDGIPLVRNLDYEIDYDIGQVTFRRPDTLFTRERSISVRYEEIPLFAETPTSILGLSTRLPLRNGALEFTAINQAQRSTFTRPTLGFEPASSFIAGLNASFGWALPSLRGAAPVQPGDSLRRRTTLRLNAELAMSKPNTGSRNIAHIESFQNEAGFGVPYAESQWYFSGPPIASPGLPGTLVTQERAATLVWQNYALDALGRVITFTTEEIDPNVALVGRFAAPAPLQMLTLYPLSIGGARASNGEFEWTIAGAPGGRRWRSMRVPLAPGGADLTQVEQIEGWALIDTATARRGRNPALVIDLGDVSERSLTFSPDTLLVSSAGGSTTFAGFRGRRLQGAESVDTERDRFSRTFDASVNDTGLPGDVADRLVVVEAQTGTPLRDSLAARVCQADRRILRLGDTRANCSVQNARLDEEDLDNDGVLNVDRDAERVFRIVLDFSRNDSYERVGGCIPAGDPRLGNTTELCWVHYRAPLDEAEVIGAPLRRRVKAVRLTVISGAELPDDAFTHLPLTQITLAGAPWQKRDDVPALGIAGSSPGDGVVLTSLIGTQDSSAALPYQPPPGVREQAEDIAGEFGVGQIQINERALRLRAVGLDLRERAEAYFRFPEGNKNFMGYRQLRVWARGRNNGWGEGGDLNFFVRIGRDADNFYLYRTPVNSGDFQSAWEPEIRVDFSRFFALRGVLEGGFRGSASVSGSGCTSADSALIAASGGPGGSIPAGARFACDGSYMVYTANIAVTPPSLAAVQELAVGMLRVSEGGGATPIITGDTLELWVDEIRLAGVVNDAGYAGYVGLELSGPGFADVRVGIMRRSADFRQLGEHPTFSTDDVLELSSTFRLDRISRSVSGWILPLTITHSASLSDPRFVSGSDIPGASLAALRAPRSARTRYTLSARKAPVAGGTLLDRALSSVTLNGTWSSSDARSAYDVGSGSDFSIGATVNLASGSSGISRGRPEPDSVTAPPDTAAGESRGRNPWQPTRLEFGTQVMRRANIRNAFISPASGGGGFPRELRGLEHNWLTSGALELRPTDAVTARWELTTLRDLRDYGDTSDAARAAGEARGSLFGADIGMERERVLRTYVGFSPVVRYWLRPRASLSTRYGMLRDPNARELIPLGTSESDLPLRYGASQNVSAGVTIDPAALVASLSDSAAAVAVGRVFLPLEVNLSRNVVSTFRSARDEPSLLYQFTLGGTDLFRRQDGRDATSAGTTDVASAAHSIVLWPGATLSNRFTRSISRSWSESPGGGVPVVNGEAHTFPDLSLRVSNRFSESAAIRQIGAQLGARHTSREILIPSLLLPGVRDRSRDESRSYPASLTLGWGALGGFTTMMSHNLTLREDTRPGLLIDGSTRDSGVEIARLFPAGSIGFLHDELRARVSYSASSTRSVVQTPGVTAKSRLVDNGWYRLALSGDSDVSDTMVLMLSASHLVRYDRNFNRRVTQTLFSTTLQIRFFATPGRM